MISSLPHTPPLAMRHTETVTALRKVRLWQPSSNRYGRALGRLIGVVAVRIRPRTPPILDCSAGRTLATRLAWRCPVTRFRCTATVARVRDARGVYDE